MIEIRDSGSCSAQKIMEEDRKLLSSLSPDSNPILHLYEWGSPSVTYGHFIDITRFFDMEKSKKKFIDFAKRPTGGGVLFHIWDYAFSFLLPAGSSYFSANTLENYHFVHQVISKLLAELFLVEKIDLIKDDYKPAHPSSQFFCMARPTKYDLLLGDKKIVGAAQRRTKSGYLHQGTIALCPPDPVYLSLLKDKKLQEEILLHSYSFIQSEDLSQMRKKIKDKLISSFSRLFPAT